MRNCDGSRKRGRAGDEQGGRVAWSFELRATSHRVDAHRHRLESQDAHSSPVARSSKQTQKSALRISQSALGSPPPELPNHEWIVRLPTQSVNVTLVISALVCGNHGELTNVIKGRSRSCHGFAPTSLIAEEKSPRTRTRGCRRLPSIWQSRLSLFSKRPQPLARLSGLRPAHCAPAKAGLAGVKARQDG